ncbi:MAG: hypothetical protein Q9209_007056 [Squamulea sp. 1 TL-2023]
MCIHHISFHTPCGHTTQATSKLIHCDPVAAAVAFYDDQPNKACNHEGRFHNIPMKPPQPCGGRDIRKLRPLPVIVGQDRSFRPEGWQANMTSMVRSLLGKGEDVETIIILLEAEYPKMISKVSEKWIHHLEDCFQYPELKWSPPQDLQNDGLAGTIITDTVHIGCGGFKSGNPACFHGWDNPYGGKAFCPVLWSIEMGKPLPQRAEDDLEPHSSENGKMLTFGERFHRELQLQAQESIMLYGSEHGSPQASRFSFPPAPLLTEPLVQSLISVSPEAEYPETRPRPSTKGYRWPPTPTPENQKRHMKSASI